MLLSRLLRHAEPDPRQEKAETLDELGWELRQALEAGDKLQAELVQASINDLLDHWSD